ncbi:DUF4920 domain-containing protein [Pedobacter sp. HMF7647]|uniref:DUF4920 domain-containing protein n=1 Tax=Hufsiella arboris TaxID=2695275 RepID=A0A7K1YB51_9SPHI|nr:DUF4920 domain-containing protein [Hufsiella arboris]MXV51581.1 DUF4920 domain-containing protein [Hufsiella arboris]
MKKLILLILPVFFYACTSEKTRLSAVGNIHSEQAFGDSVKNSGIIDADALATAMNKKDKLDTRIKGEVLEVDPAKSELRLKLNDGAYLPVVLRDTTLSIPKELKGKQIVLDGYAFIDSIKDADNIKGNTKTRLAYNASGLAVLE